MTSCDFVCKPNITSSSGVTFIFIFVNKFAKEYNPADKQSRFNVDTMSYDIIQSRIGVETTSYQRWNDVACLRGRIMCSSKVHWWQDVSYSLLHDFSFHGTPWDYINEVVEKFGILSSLASTKLDHFQESSTLQTPNFFGWDTTSYDFYLNCSKNLIFTWNLFKKWYILKLEKKSLA